MSRRAPLLLLVVIYLGFVSLGLPDGTLGVAWPQMHVALGMPLGLAGTLLAVATILSGISSFSSPAILRRFGTGPVVLVSCALTGAALLIIGRAQNLAWLLVAAAPLGFGAGAVDTGLNSYVARHYSGRHMNWLHACWGIGATSGPFLMSRALDTAQGWRTGYIVIGSVQLTLAVVFFLTLRLWTAVPERTVHEPHGTSPARQPTLDANSEAGWLSALIFIFYVAVEATVGLWAGSILVAGRGLEAPTAGLCVTAYYGSITAGRILIGFVSERLGNRLLVSAGIVVALAGVLFFSQAGTFSTALIALILTGVGFAPVYPCLMHEVPRRFAPQAVTKVIGRQSGAAYIGGAAVPAAAGWVVAQFSLQAVVWVVAGGVLLMALTVRRLDRIT